MRHMPQRFGVHTVLEKAPMSSPKRPPGMIYKVQLEGKEVASQFVANPTDQPQQSNSYGNSQRECETNREQQESSSSDCTDSEAVGENEHLSVRSKHTERPQVKGSLKLPNNRAVSERHHVSGSEHSEFQSPTSLDLEKSIWRDKTKMFDNSEQNQALPTQDREKPTQSCNTLDPKPQDLGKTQDQGKTQGQGKTQAHSKSKMQVVKTSKEYRTQHPRNVTTLFEVESSQELAKEHANYEVTTAGLAPTGETLNEQQGYLDTSELSEANVVSTVTQAKATLQDFEGAQEAAKILGESQVTTSTGSLTKFGQKDTQSGGDLLTADLPVQQKDIWQSYEESSLPSVPGCQSPAKPQGAAQS